MAEKAGPLFRLAHISDLHIPPLPEVQGRDLWNKRWLGFWNWQLKRRKRHSREALGLILADLKAQAPDHIAVTGDLINLALPEEFARAAALLAEIGPPDRVSVVPGNHDAYVSVPWDQGLGLWAPYMTGREGMPMDRERRFPFVREVAASEAQSQAPGAAKIVLIGVSSAIPSFWGRAVGRVGIRQSNAMTEALHHYGDGSWLRVVLIHHPPLFGQAGFGRGLVDNFSLGSIFQLAGAELLLHGHNHRRSLRRLKTRYHGTAYAIGAASASSPGQIGHQMPASYHLIEVWRTGQHYRVDLIARGLNPRSATGVNEIARETLLGTD